MPLHYRLQSGDIVEILTSKQERGPSRDWLVARQDDARPQQDPRLVQARAARGLGAPRPRDAAGDARKQGLPAQKIAGSPLLADVIREMGFKKADDFYIALGQAKISAQRRHQQAPAAAEAGRGGRRGAARRRRCSSGRDERRGPRAAASGYGIQVEGIDDVMLRLAKCCRPVPGDQIVGYISLGRGITIHRDRLPERAGS